MITKTYEIQFVVDTQATFLHVVPPIILFLAQHPLVDKYDLSSVTDFFTGAAPVGNKVLEQVVNRMKHDVKFRQGTWEWVEYSYY